MTGAIHTRRFEIEAFVTKDGSVIRELMHPATQASRAQSLAEATLGPGTITVLHRHHASEELYFILEGSAEMTLDAKAFPVAAGDTVCIAPGTGHRIRNTGVTPLRLLCCCAPAYRDDDTELL